MTGKIGTKQDQATEPATYMLPNWKTQNRSRCWESKGELCNIMAQLRSLDKFKLLEILGVQATYNHTDDMNEHLKLIFDTTTTKFDNITRKIITKD